jgi:Uma2 family endonuclease
MATRSELIKQLYTIPGKAEIVGDSIVCFPPDYAAVSYAQGEILFSLREYEKRTKLGRAVGCNAAFLVELPHRGSFSPDAAYYVGPDPGMKFYEGAPVFAVEVRSESDYGPTAEREIAQKRSDYFAAGTLVEWDVDLLYDEAVYVYRASDPDNPTVYKRGEVAEAEPAVPGWSMPVGDLFTPE